MDNLENSDTKIFTPVVITSNKKGYKRLLTTDNYVFMKHSDQKTVIYWKCSLSGKGPKCKASLKTLSYESEVAQVCNAEHNHTAEAYP